MTLAALCRYGFDLSHNVSIVGWINRKNNIESWNVSEHTYVALHMHTLHMCSKTNTQMKSTKLQTLGAISESINETTHCTAASYTIRRATGLCGVYIPADRASFSQTVG